MKKRKDWVTRKDVREEKSDTDILKNFSRTLEHFLPNFRIDLLNVKDGMDERYVLYKPDIMLLERILSVICKIESRN